MKPIIAIPAIAALVYRAYSKKSLTTAGILAATATAIAHAVHPWNLPFVMLVVFFLAGTRVTHVKEDIKAKLTLASTGGMSGGEGPRTHIQVFANSLTASILTLLHAYQLSKRPASAPAPCFAFPGDPLVIGIIANYAAAAADTFSSELGILSNDIPRLITAPWRMVPRGTNGGVTLWGLTAGALGSFIVVASALPFLNLCHDNWPAEGPLQLAAVLTVWGLGGSVLDSVLGAVFQRSVRDVRSGKIIEGAGGKRVLVSPGESKQLKQASVKAPLLSGEGKEGVEKIDGNRERANSRAVENGWDVLDNNEVNFLMCLTMSLGAVAISAYLGDRSLWEVFSI